MALKKGAKQASAPEAKEEAHGYEFGGPYAHSYHAPTALDSDSNML